MFTLSGDEFLFCLQLSWLGPRSMNYETILKNKKSEKKIPLYLSIVHQIVFQIYENLSHKMYIIVFMMFSSLLGIMFHITDIFYVLDFCYGVK